MQRCLAWIGSYAVAEKAAAASPIATASSCAADSIAALRTSTTRAARVRSKTCCAFWRRPFGCAHLAMMSLWVRPLSRCSV